MRDKLLDSNNSEFSDTDVSSNTDFGAQEYDAFLLVIGDKSGVCVIMRMWLIFCDKTWAIMSDNEKFSGISGPQDTANCLTKAVNIFVQYFVTDMVQKIVTDTNRYAEQFKSSRGSIFSKRSRVNQWKLVTTEEIHVVLSLFMLMGIVQKPSLRLYFSRNPPEVTPVFGSVISLDRFESISGFLHFIDISKDTYQWPQKLLKSIP